MPAALPILRSVHQTAAAWDYEDTTITGLSGNTITPRDPEVSVSFQPPESGYVLLTVAGGLRSSSGASNRARIGIEVRQQNARGAPVLSMGTDNYWGTFPAQTTYAYRERSILLNLDPFIHYYARVMWQNSTAGGEMDNSVASLLAVPIGSDDVSSSPFSTARDRLAGQTVHSIETPDPIQVLDETTVTGNTDDVFTSVAPEVSGTFVAPLSGRVLCIVGGGMRFNSANNRAWMAYEMREDDSSGTIVVDPNTGGTANRTQYGTAGGTLVTNYTYYDRKSITEGLEPGRTYFIRVMTRRSASSGEYDFFNRGIIVVPVS